MSEGKVYFTNVAKERLKRGEPLLTFGVWEFFRPVVAKIAARAGFHALIIEGEHEFHDLVAMTDFIVSARDNGLSVIVSVPTEERHFVSRVMDAGAHGIMLPHAETAEQVTHVARMMKYPPVGERGIVWGPNTDFYAPDDVRAYVEQANEATMLMVKIESRKGVDNAEAMFETGFVDCLVFGPMDMSADFGVAGQTDHPDVRRAIERMSQAALDRGIAIIGKSTDRSTYREERERGAQMFATLSEMELLAQAAEQWMDITR